MTAPGFIKFLPSDEGIHKTNINARNMSGKKVILTVDHSYDKCQKALWDYNHGEHIQDAFSFLSPDERNFMQTGLTSKEWDALFEEEDDEDVF